MAVFDVPVVWHSQSRVRQFEVRWVEPEEIDPMVTRSYYARTSRRVQNAIKADPHFPSIGLVIFTRQDNGLLAPITGRTRIKAMSDRPLLGLIVDDLEEADEALIWLREGDRSPQNPQRRFHARLMVGETTAKQIDEVVGLCGFYLNLAERKSRLIDPNEIQAVSALDYIYREEQIGGVHWVLSFIRRSFGATVGTGHADVLRGVREFRRRVIDCPTFEFKKTAATLLRRLTCLSAEQTALKGKIVTPSDIARQRQKLLQSEHKYAHARAFAVALILLHNEEERERERWIYDMRNREEQALAIA